MVSHRAATPSFRSEVWTDRQISAEREPTHLDRTGLALYTFGSREGNQIRVELHSMRYNGRRVSQDSPKYI